MAWHSSKWDVFHHNLHVPGLFFEVYAPLDPPCSVILSNRVFIDLLAYQGHLGQGVSLRHARTVFTLSIWLCCSVQIHFTESWNEVSSPQSLELTLTKDKVSWRMLEPQSVYLSANLMSLYYNRPLKGEAQSHKTQRPYKIDMKEIRVIAVPHSYLAY